MQTLSLSFGQPLKCGHCFLVLGEGAPQEALSLGVSFMWFWCKVAHEERGKEVRWKKCTAADMKLGSPNLPFFPGPLRTNTNVQVPAHGTLKSAVPCPELAYALFEVPLKPFPCNECFLPVSKGKKKPSISSNIISFLFACSVPSFITFVSLDLGTVIKPTFSLSPGILL